MSTGFSTNDAGEGPRTRAVLTRDRIVAAAVDLVDELGPDALTMRAVAARLGAGAMSLYRHVSGREELLDLVLASMVGDVAETPLTGEWRKDFAAIARDVRRGLLRRPHLTVLLTSRSGRGGSEISMLERTLGVLRQAGLSREEAVLANHALGNYVAGAAMWEAVGMGGATGEERSARLAAAAEATKRIPADRFPNVAWVGAAIVEGTLEERFEFGLGLLLDGVERLVSGIPDGSTERRPSLPSKRATTAHLELEGDGADGA